MTLISQLKEIQKLYPELIKIHSSEGGYFRTLITTSISYKQNFGHFKDHFIPENCKLIKDLLIHICKINQWQYMLIGNLHSTPQYYCNIYTTFNYISSSSGPICKAPINNSYYNTELEAFAAAIINAQVRMESKIPALDLYTIPEPQLGSEHPSKDKAQDFRDDFYGESDKTIWAQSDIFKERED